MAKDTIPAPIDKPLASSYLRGFEGLCTAYPPELAPPTTLRSMENLLVTPEGALRIRPGLRSIFPVDYWLSNINESIVGGYEHFLADAGQKGILFAVRLADETVVFRTFVETGDGFELSTSVIPDLASVVLPASVTFIKYLQIDNKILALPNDSTVGAVLFYVGLDKAVKRVTPAGLTVPAWTDVPVIRHPDAAWINAATKVSIPAAETPTSGTTGTLISATATENTWHFGYYYTFETEFGESAPSGVTTVKTQRGWSQWLLNVPDGSGNKTTPVATDIYRAMDQLVAILPTGLYDTAKGQGAIKWNLYMFTWSDTTAVPTTGVMVAQRQITPSGTPDTEGWVVNTLSALADTWLTPVPTEASRENYSGAPTATQGLVAADRLILVNDANARIAWSTGLVQDYMNFSPSRGGGQKTLSTGNLALPVAVALWQNPQAIDTLTVLCSGLDGYHSAYYMSPSSVSGQSDSTLIMGFEETTATPGTVSPYGCEVYRSALYHPLEQGLMKSTANNYAITHTMMTDDIADKWRRLLHKENIVSSQLNDNIYYIVHNPQGIELPDACMGNEIWVCNPGKEGTTWSRWLVPAIALRRIEIDDILYMSVVTPTAIFILDPYAYADDVVGEDGTTAKAHVPWFFETNTLGANSRHDIQVQLQQATLHFGDWVGKARWGIKGWEGNGRPRNINKLFHGNQPDPALWPSVDYGMDPTLDLGDTKDPLLIQEMFTEWTLWGRSEGEELSYGQIDMAQFRFAQLTVNDGYQRGSIETFEYARNVAAGNNIITQQGIPRPVADVRRP